MAEVPLPSDHPRNAESLSEYRPDDLPEHLRWKGEGPAPRRWTAPDGTIVYRSYADYCDD